MGDIYYNEKLVNAVIETKKPYNLLFRKAGGVSQPESEGLRTKGADDINLSSNTGEDEMQYPSSKNKAEKKMG